MCYILSVLFEMTLDDLVGQELLALGERIGNVSTGLSEDLISKCLTESIYCSSGQFQDESSCVICLVRIYFCLKRKNCGFYGMSQVPAAT